MTHDNARAQEGSPPRLVPIGLSIMNGGLAVAVFSATRTIYEAGYHGWWTTPIEWAGPVLVIYAVFQAAYWLGQGLSHGQKARALRVSAHGQRDAKARCAPKPSPNATPQPWDGTERRLVDRRQSDRRQCVTRDSNQNGAAGDDARGPGDSFRLQASGVAA